MHRRRVFAVSGAKCEANTFDGERCLYGALSDPIRRLLKEYKRITAKAMQRDYYDQFLQTWGPQTHTNTNHAHFHKLTECFSPYRLLEQGNYSDVTFMVHGEMFKAHRCVLSARSEYFAHMLETKWKGKSDITLKHPLVGAGPLHKSLSLYCMHPFCATRKPIFHDFTFLWTFS